MPVSEFRSAELMDVNSLGKESIFNDLAQNFSRGISGYLQVPLGGLTTLDLASDTDDLSLYAVLRFTGALTAPCTVTAPSRARVYILENQTTGAFALTFTTSSGVGVPLPQGQRALYYSDSTEVYVVAGGESTGLLVTRTDGSWIWDTVTTGVPATGHIGINNVAMTSATELRLAQLGSDGVDRQVGLRDLRSQDEVYLQDKDDSTHFVRYRFTGAGIDQGTWFTLPITWVTSGGAAFTNNMALVAVFSTSASVPRATTTQPGITVLSDPPLTLGGLDDTTAVTPASLQAKWATIPPLPVQATTTVVGLTRYATGPEGTAGALDTVAMTPLTVQAKINAIPLASETVVGLAERATIAEAIGGTDPTRYVSAAGLQAKIDTLPVAPITGTPYSLLRIPSSGTGQQASPLTVDAAGAVLAKATNVNPIWIWQAEHTTTTGSVILEAYQPGTGAPSLVIRKAKGTVAAPLRETTVGSGPFNLVGQTYARIADDLSDGWVGLGSQQFMVESVDAQFRVGGFWKLSTAPGVSAAVVEAMRVTQAGNLLLGATTHGTGLVKGLVVGSGVAPTTSPADAVQLWSADRGGVAGKAGLHLRTEDGTSHVFGDRVGIGTLTPSHRLEVYIAEGPPVAERAFTARYVGTLQANLSGGIVGSTINASLNPAGFTLSGFPALIALQTTASLSGTAGTVNDAYVYDAQVSVFGTSGLGTVWYYHARLNNSGGGPVAAGIGFGMDAGIETAVGTFYGFYGLANAAANKWNLYMLGTAQNYLRGNLLLGTLTSGTSLDRGLVLGSGTAPTTSPADTVQLWSADRGGLAAKASLHLRVETGTQHVLGDLVGIGTVTPAYALDVVGAINASDAAGTRTNLGLGIGTNVQAADATLTALAGVTTGADTVAYFTGVDTATTTLLTAFARTLLDDADAATAQATLGLGTASDVQFGRLGLGRATTTEARLVFLPEITHKILLYGDAVGSRYGLGVGSGETQVFSAARVVLGWMDTADGTTFTRILSTSGSAGNVGLGTITYGTGATRTLALFTGTEPTTSPADTVQLWSADRGGVAGQAGLHLRTEDGTSHVFGDKVGIGTTSPETLAQHTITAPLNAVPLLLTHLAAATTNRSPALYLLRRTSGDMADHFGVGLSYYLADNAGVNYHMGMVVMKRQGADNSGRLLLLTANAGVLASNTDPGDFAVDPVGNVSLNVDVLAGGGQRVFAIGAGVAPAYAADAAQLWVADRAGVAGQAALYVRAETQTHVFGDVVGLGTLCAATLGSGTDYQILNVRGTCLFAISSSLQERASAALTPSWTVNTDATRQGRLLFYAYDATAGREVLRLSTNGTAATMSFLGGLAPVARQTVPAAATDATTTQALCNAIRTALVNFGLCV